METVVFYEFTNVLEECKVSILGLKSKPWKQAEEAENGRFVCV